MDNCYSKSKQILVKNRAKLDKVAKALSEKGALETDEFEELIGKKSG